MQLIDTQVRTAGDMTTVEFQGEGGELVSVKMAAASVEGDAAISRAKALMVQLTAFSEDRDPSQDFSRPSEERGDLVEGSAKTKPDLPIVSSFNTAPGSIA
jgi:hypothetical protein